MDKKALGETIKKYRKQANITQKQLAKLIEKSESTIQKYESGEVEPPLSVLEQIAFNLKLDVVEILDEGNSISVLDYVNLHWGADDSLLECCKALGYEFKTHPTDPNNYMLLTHYGYSYEVPINTWLEFIDSSCSEIKSSLDQIIEKYVTSRKIIKTDSD